MTDLQRRQAIEHIAKLTENLKHADFVCSCIVTDHTSENGERAQTLPILDPELRKSLASFFERWAVGKLQAIKEGVA